MLDYVIFATTAIIALIVSIIYLLPGRKRVTTIPGPDISDELEGNFPDIAAAGSLHEFLKDLHGHYGPIVHFWMGPEMTVSVSSPELHKELSKVFDRPPSLFELYKPVWTEDAIQYANGVDGRMRHAAYARSFSHENVSGYFGTMQAVTDDLVANWSKKPRDEHIPLRECMFSYAIMNILKCAFGKYFADERKVLKIRKAYDIIWHDMEKQISGHQLEEGSARQKLFDQEIKNMHTIFKDAYCHAKENQSEDDEEFNFINVLVELGLSDGKALGDISTVFVGGFHTTGLMLTWALYYLADNKEIQDKTYDEIMTVLGEDKLTPETAPQLAYLRQILDETLRCSILAPYGARYQDFDSTLGGHVIPKGTPIIHALGVTLSDPDIWANPDMFVPDRFSKENIGSIPKYAFEPFGVGKRKCLGYRFGYAEATIFLVEVLRNFEVDLVEGQVVVPDYGLVTTPREEVWITIRPRKK